MKSARKDFDKALHQESDNPSREAAIKLFSSLEDLTLLPSKSRYAVDLQCFRNGELLFNVEVEQKRVWKTQEFKYDNVQFPERKAKFCNLEKPTLFIMFNHDYSQYLSVWSKNFLTSPKVEVRNKYVFKGELFFQIPLDRVLFNSMDLEDYE